MADNHRVKALITTIKKPQRRHDAATREEGEDLADDGVDPGPARCHHGKGQPTVGALYLEARHRAFGGDTRGPIRRGSACRRGVVKQSGPSGSAEKGAAVLQAYVIATRRQITSLPPHACCQVLERSHTSRKRDCVLWPSSLETTVCVERSLSRRQRRDVIGNFGSANFAFDCVQIGVTHAAHAQPPIRIQFAMRSVGVSTSTNS